MAIKCGEKKWRERKKLLRRLRKKPSDNEIKNYVRLIKSAILTRMSKDKAAYFNNRFDPTHGSKSIWKNLNKLLGKRNDGEIKRIVSHNLTTLTEPNDIATYSIQFCVDKCNELVREAELRASSTNQSDNPCHVESTMHLSTPSEAEIAKIIASNPPKMSTGVDGISMFAVKRLAPSLISPITKLVAKCFETGIFPSAFKLAKAVPIFKGVVKDDAANYRLVSVSSPLNRIIEKAMASRITSFLDKNNSPNKNSMDTERKSEQQWLL